LPCGSFSSRSRVALAFLVELSAAMIVASTLVPSAATPGALLAKPASAAKMALLSPQAKLTSAVYPSPHPHTRRSTTSLYLYRSTCAEGSLRAPTQRAKDAMAPLGEALLSQEFASKDANLSFLAPLAAVRSHIRLSTDSTEAPSPLLRAFRRHRWRSSSLSTTLRIPGICCKSWA
jgi:hypothetical protein